MLKHGIGNDYKSARGTVLRVTCKPGYELDPPKKKIKCKRGGEWKPEMPKCLPIGCDLPRMVQGGHFVDQKGKALPLNARVEHGHDIDVVCHQGHFLNGADRLRCWYGDWSGGSSAIFGMPKCVGNPCVLPEITGEPCFRSHSSRVRQLIFSWTRLSRESRLIQSKAL